MSEYNIVKTDSGKYKIEGITESPEYEYKTCAKHALNIRIKTGKWPTQEEDRIDAADVQAYNDYGYGWQGLIAFYKAKRGIMDKLADTGSWNKDTEPGGWEIEANTADTDRAVVHASQDADNISACKIALLNIQKIYERGYDIGCNGDCKYSVSLLEMYGKLSSIEQEEIANTGSWLLWALDQFPKPNFGVCK